MRRAAAAPHIDAEPVGELTLKGFHRSGVLTQRSRDPRINLELSRVNRVTAAILAFVWAGAGIAGLAAGYVYGRWLVAVPALFALWYAGLWLRVAVQARLLSWSDVVRPWRAR